MFFLIRDQLMIYFNTIHWGTTPFTKPKQPMAIDNVTSDLDR